MQRASVDFVTTGAAQLGTPCQRPMANTRGCPYAALMLGQRLRRWPNIKTA